MLPLKEPHTGLIQRLLQLREEADLTQEAVAELAGVSYKHYQSIEAGRKRDVRLSTLYQLADAYGLEAWELLYPQAPVLSPKFHRRVQNMARKRAKSGSNG